MNIVVFVCEREQGFNILYIDTHVTHAFVLFTVTY